jgi:hypothetical protein
MVAAHPTAIKLTAPKQREKRKTKNAPKPATAKCGCKPADHNYKWGSYYNHIKGKHKGMVPVGSSQYL